MNQSSLRNMARKLLCVLGLVILTACSGIPADQSDANDLPSGLVAGDANLSPFYSWRDEVPQRSGQLLREQAVPRQTRMPSVQQAYRILYTSTDARWHSGYIPVSGMLYLPEGDMPDGGWPLLAWGHGTLGIADACAPSWTGFKDRDAEYMNRWLDAGFAVVATDYQGLGGPGPHPYHYWPAEARSILDAARAVISAKPGQISNRLIVAGQSQGAGAALGTAMLSEQYAKDTHLLGVISTGLNNTFPEGPVPVPVRNSPNMFLRFASGGLTDNAPQVEDILSPKGRQLLDEARTACTGEIMKLARQLRVASLDDALAIPLAELQDFRLPVTDMPMRSTGIPILVATGLADTTIDPRRQYAAVSALCEAGNDVTWLRYQGLDHDGAMEGSFDDSLAFAHARLQGKKVVSQCDHVSAPALNRDHEPEWVFPGWGGD